MRKRDKEEKNGSKEGSKPFGATAARKIEAVLLLMMMMVMVMMSSPV
jgi:hypothetical protein